MVEAMVKSQTPFRKSLNWLDWFNVKRITAAIDDIDDLSLHQGEILTTAGIPPGSLKFDLSGSAWINGLGHNGFKAIVPIGIH
jgi:hypothetical protein